MPIQKLRSVLYVDDDPDICEVVHATLSAIADLQVQVASSGERAIEMTQAERPDLVLMDVMMPGLDGPSTLKRMQENPKIADIPVIFLTAKVLPTEVAAFLKQGAIGVIGKPFDPTRLCADILTLWSNASKAGAIRTIRQADMESTGAHLSALSRGFLERARTDIARLQKMVECVVEGDQSALGEAERVAHSLHGAAAMFGFPAVSACGGALEALLEELTTASDPAASLEPGILRQLSERTERLAQEIEVAGVASERAAAADCNLSPAGQPSAAH